MSKYVAFLDILGFKEKLKKLKQQDAKSFIGRFSTTAFEQWEDMSPTLVEGYYIVSDSLYFIRVIQAHKLSPNYLH